MRRSSSAYSIARAPAKKYGIGALLRVQSALTKVAGDTHRLSYRSCRSVVVWMQVQKKYAPPDTVSRFHTSVCGTFPFAPRAFRIAGRDSGLKEVRRERGPISLYAAGPNLLHHRSTVNLLDRDAASV
jgi:hypothetical protein